jgi:23S rRNA (cytidine1920-2'-O)/16S rRNA (cytidine1409-2'-O)-methyltransferase
MRERLDTALVARGLVESREKAKRLILAGAVRINGQVAGKPSDWVADDSTITLAASEKYVSRGGYKLEAGIIAFQIPIAGKSCLDIGASTGGFTDCLLQHGAAKVRAVDVGKGQLAWKLRQDPRVTIEDEVNARHITGAPVDIITVDVSFISLTKILPAAGKLLAPGGHLLALIKPQFEAGQEDVGKGGVVRNPVVHARVQREVLACVQSIGLTPLGIIESPILGPAGNKEFLIVAHRSPELIHHAE